MAFTPRLELRHSQTLVMTPQLQRAIKLLQFSNLELREFVEEELTENPLLERDEGDLSPDNNMVEEQSPNAQADNYPLESLVSPDSTDELDSLDLGSQEHVSEHQVNTLDLDEYDTVGEHESIPGPGPVDTGYISDWGTGRSIGFDNDEYSIEETLSQKLSLRDHLLNQIQLEIPDPKERMIAVYLTNHLDEYGRLPDALEDLAIRLGCDLAKMEHVLSCLQEFEPPGIFARSLTECWTIQLRDRNHLDPAMVTLLENIELLKMHDYEALTKLCHVQLDDIQDMINEIWSLTHNPAEAFDQIIIQSVSPDVTMRRGAGDKWIIELNNAVLPKVLVNHTYYAEVCGTVRTKEDRKYVTDKLQWANWLIKSLHQRATTILKVASEIVTQQEKFFQFGVEYLKPLVLRDVADEIEMHESTVSRVTSNKYIDTPRGIFELKYFFTTAISSTNGGSDLSSETVRHKIKTLIDSEMPNAILSDDKLADRLKIDGVDIARRTVAKYREAMNIPSSIQRRRQKKRLATFT